MTLRTDIGRGENRDEKNKAGYTAQDAPSTRLKITRDGRTYGRTYGLTDGRTDGPSYRDATAHLKSGRGKQPAAMETSLSLCSSACHNELNEDRSVAMETGKSLKEIEYRGKLLSF